MKFTSTQENLNHALSLVAGLAGRSAGLPILNNVLLEVKNGSLNLSATNLEIGIKTEIRGKAEQDGDFTVNAKIFSDYINILPSGHVTIELVDNQLKIRCENFQTKLRGQTAEEFPIIPALEEKNGQPIENKLLKKALNQTVFATSFDEMRPEINGILFDISQKLTTLVATDSYRLAEKKIQTEQKGVQERQIIIPLKTLQELEKVLGGSEEDVEMFVEENQVMFKVGSAVVVSRLIEGDFPDYKQIIPGKFSTTAKLKKEELIQATRAASLFARTGINDINLKFSKQRLEIKTTNAQLGEQETLLAGDINSEGVSVAFNYKYLLDGLQSIEGEGVLFEISSSSSPVILRSEKDNSYLYLIMPIKQ